MGSQNYCNENRLREATCQEVIPTWVLFLCNVGFPGELDLISWCKCVLKFSKTDSR